MNKYLLLFSFLFIIGLSCKKSAAPFNAVAQAATDDALIQAYIKTNNIIATKDTSGLYYSIISPGTRPYPTATSTVTAIYSGSLLNGTVFSPESQLNNSPLTSLVKGWQYGMPFINANGTIMLLVPSALGYGDVAQGSSIPANSVLVFVINLISFY